MEKLSLADQLIGQLLSENDTLMTALLVLQVRISYVDDGTAWATGIIQRIGQQVLVVLEWYTDNETAASTTGKISDVESMTAML